MEFSECLLGQEILENSTASDEISDAEEQKCNSEITEESSNEMNKPHSSGIITQVINGEVSERTISTNELEEQSQNPNCLPDSSDSKNGNTASFRKLSQGNSQHMLSLGFQRSRRSIGQYSLQSPKSLQEQPRVSEANTKESKSLISRRPVKELQNKFNQTSFTWEINPLSKILHPSSEIPQVSKDAEADVTDMKRDITPVGDAEKEQPSVQEFLQSSQHLEGEEFQSGHPPPAGKESSLSSQVVTLEELKHSIASPVKEEESWQRSQQPEEELSQDGSQQEYRSLENKKPPQPPQTDEANAEDGAIWISPKPSKDVKSHFNQTSFHWERKHLSSTEKKGPSHNRNQHAEGQESLAKEPSF